VSESFFSTSPLGEHDELPPESQPEIVYLTDDQIGRKQRGKRIVAATVGVLIALMVFILVRGRGSDGPRPAASASSGASAAPVATASTSQAASAVPPASSSAPALASAAPGEGGAAGEGGAKAQEGGDEGGAAPKLPDAEDPTAEAERLNNAGRYADAVDMAKAAIAKDPKNGTAYFWLGIALESLGKRDEAREAYGKCATLETDPRWIGHCKQYAPR
jgi:Flp pilus assembly protein TadD